MSRKRPSLPPLSARQEAARRRAEAVRLLAEALVEIAVREARAANDPPPPPAAPRS